MEIFDPTINEQRLDLELIRQADMVYSVGVRQADRNKELTEAKDKKKLLEAELSMEIRNNPSAYGLLKVSEAGVEAAILSAPAIVGLARTIAQLQHEVDVLTAADKALTHKRHALEHLMDLHKSLGYAELMENRRERPEPKKPRSEASTW